MNSSLLSATPLRRQLEAHCASDAHEQDALERTIRFVQAHSDHWWRRQNLVGHLTASAFVVDERRGSTLLLHHAGLDKWLQPGGHIDDGDVSPSAAALREAREETGLSQLRLVHDAVLDVDVHPIPMRIKDGVLEPEHFHYDLRFLVEAPMQDAQLSSESLGFQWLPLVALESAGIEQSILRMAQKVLHQFAD